MINGETPVQFVARLDQRGCEGNQVSHPAVDGLGGEIDRALALADRYESPAYGWSRGELLRRRAQRLVSARHRMPNPILHSDFSEAEFDMAANAEDFEMLSPGSPYLGPTLLHAANPGLEYVIRFLPSSNGGLTDTTSLAVLHVLGTFDAMQKGLQLQNAPNDDQLGQLGLDLATGRIGNTHCDWRDHSRTYEAGLQASDMNVLVLPRGNRLLAWVCCPKCRSKLDQEYPHGLCWFPDAAHLAEARPS